MAPSDAPQAVQTIEVDTLVAPLHLTRIATAPMLSDYAGPGRPGTERLQLTRPHGAGPGVGGGRSAGGGGGVGGVKMRSWGACDHKGPDADPVTSPAFVGLMNGCAADSVRGLPFENVVKPGSSAGLKDLVVGGELLAHGHAHGGAQGLLRCLV
jgi:hypothetical protein